MFPLPGPRAPKSRFPYIPDPRALAEVAHRPGCQRSGRWMVARFSPSEKATAGTRAPGVRGTLGGRAGVELAPPYLPPHPQPAGWKGEDRPSSGQLPPLHPGDPLQSDKTRSPETPPLGEAEERQMGAKGLGRRAGGLGQGAFGGSQEKDGELRSVRHLQWRGVGGALEPQG